MKCWPVSAQGSFSTDPASLACPFMFASAQKADLSLTANLRYYGANATSVLSAAAPAFSGRKLLRVVPMFGPAKPCVGDPLKKGLPLWSRRIAERATLNLPDDIGWASDFRPVWQPLNNQSANVVPWRALFTHDATPQPQRILTPEIRTVTTLKRVGRGRRRA